MDARIIFGSNIKDFATAISTFSNQSDIFLFGVYRALFTEGFKGFQDIAGPGFDENALDKIKENNGKADQKNEGPVFEPKPYDIAPQNIEEKKKYLLSLNSNLEEWRTSEDGLMFNRKGKFTGVI